MVEQHPPTRPARCLECGTELAGSSLSCPLCKRLVHADLLKALAREAAAASAASDRPGELAIWQRALRLLPVDAGQYASVEARIESLSEGGAGKGSTSAPGDAARGGGAAGRANAAKEGRFSWAKGAAGVGGAALLLWKFKFVFGFLLTKGKLLLLGLTKASTFFSMLLSFGVYWTAWGWKFALGLVLSIYVHEMGHVIALRQYGIRASAPMFIPGVGALIRLKQAPGTVHQDAQVGLAGPWWGLGAAVAAYLVSLATGWQAWAAIAQVGAWINLFNLLPVWQLDGGRAFRALERKQRWFATACLGLLWFWTAEGLLVLLLLGAGATSWWGKPPEKGDRVVLVQYVVLAICLTLLGTVSVDHGALRAP